MTIEQFIKEYNETDVMMKENYIKSRIVNHYVPYTKKIAISQGIISATSNTETNEGVKIYCVNSPSRFLLFTLNLIGEYTDIEISYDNPSDSFDALDSEGLIALLLNAIPQNDRKMFQMVFDMVRDDAYENERSLVGWMDGKVQAIKMALGSIPWDQIIEEAMNDAIEKTDQEK